MPRHYLYRTTTDKLPAAIDHIESSGHQVLERSKVDARHWVLLCRDGDHTVGNFTADELTEVITAAVRRARPLATGGVVPSATKAGR